MFDDGKPILLPFFCFHFSTIVHAMVKRGKRKAALAARQRWDYRGLVTLG